MTCPPWGKDTYTCMHTCTRAHTRTHLKQATFGHAGHWCSMSTSDEWNWSTVIPPCVCGPVEMNQARLSITLPRPPPPRTDALISHDSTRSDKNEMTDWELFCSHTGDHLCRPLTWLLSLSAASWSYVIYVFMSPFITRRLLHRFDTAANCMSNMHFPPLTN